MEAHYTELYRTRRGVIRDAGALASWTSSTQTPTRKADDTMTSRQIGRTAALLDAAGWHDVAAMLREGEPAETLKAKAVILGPDEAAELTALLDAYAEPQSTPNGSERECMDIDVRGWSVRVAADYLEALANDDCTGHLQSTPNGSIYVFHDGDSCPVHEDGK